MDTLSKRQDITELIVDFLKSHPDFFRENSWLLREMNIPHKAGKGVSSLIEHQVVLLRNEIKSLGHDVSSREIKSRQERFLYTGAFSLTMDLLSGKSMDGLYQSLQRFLSKYHIADVFKLYIFSEQHLEHSVQDITFLHRQANLRFLFIELINRHKPLCSSLQDEHIKLLFGKQCGDIDSTLVVPLVRQKWDGLLVLGNHQQGRYAYGYELDTLVFITNLLCHVLNNWLSRQEDHSESATEATVYYPTG